MHCVMILTGVSECILMSVWLLLLYMKKVFVIRAEKEENREKTIRFDWLVPLMIIDTLAKDTRPFSCLY
jgi:hypothetical protein